MNHDIYNLGLVSSAATAAESSGSIQPVCQLLHLSEYFPQISPFFRIMIGIQEDVLNMFLVTHFLLLFSNLALVFFFSILICVRNNPNFKSSFSSEAYSWWNSRQSRRPAPVYQAEQPRRRVGWFGSRFN